MPLSNVAYIAPNHKVPTHYSVAVKLATIIWIMSKMYQSDML